MTVRIQQMPQRQMSQRRMPAVLRRWWLPCWVLTRRQISSSVRNGEALTAVLAPTIFTVGFYVPLDRVMTFAGHGASSYSQFLMPMIVMQAVSFCATAAAFRAAVDARDGLDARLATMPIPHIAPLGARTASTGYRIVIALVAALMCGYVIGFRFYGGLWNTVGFLLFSVAVGMMLGVFGDLLGTLSKSPEATTQMLMLPQLILGMVSTGFAPAEQFPEWIRGFARNQPISQFVDAMRALAGDQPGFTAAVSRSTVGPGVLWTIAGVALFGVASVLVAVRRQR
ncbi:ABC transporter permease [Nocardia spumae]|uniref:ABC transporter permease n=1 Tax=Nocardia spumae TaxID=2887190 RepID=UPI001D14EC82|nr:ABC transporter permease [Nocardia spumae]